ncbi:MAG: hypothetical protein HY927_08765 [Elusimicrobia bacterium]|nr:hypothetical protein [Elusimicrobiota bacterium]
MRILLALCLSSAVLAPACLGQGASAAIDDDATLAEGARLGSQLQAQYTQYLAAPSAGADKAACEECMGFLQTIDACARVDAQHLMPKGGAKTCGGDSSDPNEPSSCSVDLGEVPYDKIAFFIRENKACRKELRKLDAKPVKEAPPDYAPCRKCYEPKLRQNRLTTMKRAYDRLAAALSARKGVRAAIDDIKARAACDWLCAPSLSRNR